MSQPSLSCLSALSSTPTSFNPHPFVPCCLPPFMCLSPLCVSLSLSPSLVFLCPYRFSAPYPPLVFLCPLSPSLVCVSVPFLLLSCFSVPSLPLSCVSLSLFSSLSRVSLSLISLSRVSLSLSFLCPLSPSRVSLSLSFLCPLSPSRVSLSLISLSRVCLCPFSPSLVFLCPLSPSLVCVSAPYPPSLVCFSVPYLPLSCVSLSLISISRVCLCPLSPSVHVGDDYRKVKELLMLGDSSSKDSNFCSIWFLLTWSCYSMGNGETNRIVFPCQKQGVIFFLPHFLFTHFLHFHFYFY